MTENVLIVDDSLTVRMDLEESFEAAGFDVRSCGTVAAARALLDEQRIDVLVLDVLLPDGDGIELLKEVRAGASHATTVVLMLSTEAEVQARVRGLRTGADEYVGKPYDSGYVVAKARELWRTRQAASDAQPHIRPTTILVVDDSPTFRNALRYALEQAGYAVEVASTGEDGLRAAASIRPDAIIVDSLLPGIDGATVIRRLRLDAALRGTPSMLLTGLNDRNAELQALEAGADLFVRKDEEVQVILARLAVALRNAAAPGGGNTTSLLGPKKVLAVDDSPTWLAELTTALRDEGYDVVSAHSGEEALELLEVQAMDCILLDLMMPGLGGRETCRRIKAMPATRDIPLILLTAMEDRAAMLDGLDAGADDYIQKSAEFEVLKARVRAQIRRKQFEDESWRVRTELANAELEAAHARSAQALAESRAELLAQLEQKNRVLEAVNSELRARQFEIAQTNLELTAASNAKSEFLSMMSHELRTPLNAIIGFSDLLRDDLAGALTPRQREFVNYIRDGGDHLLELINDILDLSKIEAGRVEIDPEPVDLDTLLSEALTVVRERAHARGVCLEAHGLGTSQPINVDRRRLKQIVYNLLTNAVKFTPDGGNVSVDASIVDRRQASSSLPGFSVGVRQPLPDNAYQSFVQICVSDSGVGIAREDLDRLFTPFSQIKNAFTRNVEGTGLGLVTVARLAQLHGGTVSVTSEPGRGSCFTLWLPWQFDRIEATNAAASHKPVALVVEDDAMAAELLRIQLESAGFDVHQSSSAEDAMALAGNCTPDLITLDIRLPGMDGWSFLGAIKSVPKWADIPVVVVSFAANREIGLSLGAAGIMQKPVNRHEFIRELNLLGFKPTPAHQITVLVIDDDPSAVELMSAYLGQPGYQTLRAFGGQEGIDLAMRHLPDLVVLDLLMPDIGGIEVVEALKLNPQTAEIPVIIVTAKEFSDEDRTQLSEHVLSVVSKGDMNGRRFINEVRRACGKAVPVNAPG